METLFYRIEQNNTINKEDKLNKYRGKIFTGKWKQQYRAVEWIKNYFKIAKKKTKKSIIRQIKTKTNKKGIIGRKYKLI